MADNPDDVLVVLTTTDKPDEAERIGRLLVEQRLAACVQVVGPIRSIYRWQGRIETAEEWQLWIKTRRPLYDRVEQTIRAEHYYDVPEILALPVEAGSAAYLGWLAGQLESE